VPGLPQGTKAGTVCNRPVSLLSLYPTLTQLTGLPAKEDNSGPTLVPLLENPEVVWNDVATVCLGEPGSCGISGDDWRYIHYANGDEELYEIRKDPYEWTNLAQNPEYASKLAEMRKHVPEKFAPLVEASVGSLHALTWVPAPDGKAPASKPDGGTFDVFFVNKREHPVELCWMDREGKPKSYGIIKAGKNKRQKTRPGAVWMIRNQKGVEIGHFVVGDRKSQAVIPE
jgi:hypothetical protein